MRQHFLVLVAVLAIVPLLAQAQQLPKTPPVQAKSAKAASASKHLTVDDVLSLVTAGVSDEVVIARLRKEDSPFDLTTDELIRLKKANVNANIVKVMMDPKADVGTSPSAAPSRITPPPAVPQQVVVQAPVLPTIVTANRSGATPAAGANADGDPNDPLVPHDSGIYLYTKDRDGRPSMVVLERAAYQGAKSGGIFASAITYGAVKAKTKALIQGPRAGIRVSDSSPVFYFYFDDKQAGLGKTYFGVSNLSNPNQFVLVRLEVNKSNRETLIGQYSAWGASSGSDSHAMIQFKSERIRSGLYKVTVDTIKPGEYCFQASSGPQTTGITAAYGGVASTDLFDFGVDLE